jgi:hypothetical protein
MAKKKKRICKPSFRISHAGHLLATRGTSSSGRVLSAEGKREKKKRLKRGCLNGTGGTFKLTQKQKRNLPEHLKRAIIKYHRRQGKRIIED